MGGIYQKKYVKKKKLEAGELTPESGGVPSQDDRVGKARRNYCRQGELSFRRNRVGEDPDRLGRETKEEPMKSSEEH